MSFIFCTLIYLCVFTICAHLTNVKKNVVLIIVDDLRPALGCYDDKIAVTPNIDQFAKKSTIFQRAYAQQALCAPSRNSMLVSRRPDTLQLYDFYSYWRDTIGNFTTIPQYFKSNGYTTYSIGKVFHPGKSSNFTDDYPYSWSNTTFHPSTEAYMNDAICFDRKLNKLEKNVICPVTLESQPEKTLPDIQSVQEAKRILSVTDEPFFMAIGFHKPHIPFRFPSQYLKYHNLNKFTNINFDFVPYNLPTIAFNPYNDIRERDDAQRANISFPFGPVPKQFGWLLRQSYYASVTYIDHLLGDLFDHINFSNTVIVLTSDHGWSLGEHAEWAKYSNYEVAVRVPFIIYSPEHKNAKAKRIFQIAELVDLFPTLVDLAQLPPIKECNNSKYTTCTEGKSLYQHLTNITKTNSVAISQYPRPSKYPKMYPDSDRPHLKSIKFMGYSIRTNNFRYTNWIKFNRKTFKSDWTKCYGEELYDHSIDPAEMINLSKRGQFNNIKIQLKKLLRTKINDGVFKENIDLIKT